MCDEFDHLLFVCKAVESPSPPFIFVALRRRPSRAANGPNTNDLVDGNGVRGGGGTGSASRNSPMHAATDNGTNNVTDGTPVARTAPAPAPRAAQHLASDLALAASEEGGDGMIAMRSL